jgi:hypothetical protein
MDEGMNMEKLCNESGMGKVKYLEKNQSSAPFSTRNPTWFGLGPNHTAYIFVSEIYITKH